MIETNWIDRLELESTCPVCKGEARWRLGNGEWHYCGNCDGAGFMPTPLGERILTLMRHNFRPMLQDAQDD
jgi:ribosomal protein L37AE/L43A